MLLELLLLIISAAVTNYGCLWRAPSGSTEPAGLPGRWGRAGAGAGLEAGQGWSRGLPGRWGRAGRGRDGAQGRGRCQGARAVPGCAPGHGSAAAALTARAALDSSLSARREARRHQHPFSTEQPCAGSPKEISTGYLAIREMAPASLCPAVRCCIHRFFAKSLCKLLNLHLHLALDLCLQFSV